MAIVIDGIKHACASCIRGHRVKKCNHSDRQLIPLLKRGRQVSQCEHCRDLRKTNKSHVKCTCAVGNMPNPITGCLCQVILTCSCVASHLQEIKMSPELTPTTTAISTPSLSDQDFTQQDIFKLDQELIHFLENDLDKYLTSDNTLQQP